MRRQAPQRRGAAWRQSARDSLGHDVGVCNAVGDHRPAPWPLLALTRTWYRVPLVKPAIVAVVPEIVTLVLLHAPHVGFEAHVNTCVSEFVAVQGRYCTS